MRYNMVMNMTWTYIWSQILTVVEYGLLGASYLARKRRAIVLLDIVSMATGIVVYVLLGADLGMAMSVVILLANFYYLWDERNEGKKNRLTLRDYVVLAIVLALIAGLAVLTYDGPLSLLSVAATVLYEISIFWQGNAKVYKLLGLPVALCWMTYNGFIGSIFGVICEAVMFVASVVGFVKEVKAGKKKRTGKRAKKQGRKRK